MFDQFNWQFNAVSILIGIFIGVIFSIILYLISAPVRRTWRRFAGWVSNQNAWLRAGVETRFRADTASYVSKLHLTSQSASVEKLFVAPRFLAPQAAIDSEQGSLEGVERLFYLWPEMADGVGLTPPPSVTLRQLLRRGRRVVIADEHGAGKTTLFAYIARMGNSEDSAGPFQFLSERLPVFLHLSEFQLLRAKQDHSVLESPDPLDPLTQVLRERMTALDRRKVQNLLRSKAEEGSLFLLLDGWDEIVNQKFEWTLSWLKLLLNEHPDIWIFVAGPKNGFGPLVDLGFSVTSILPWRIGQVEELSTLWSKEVGTGEAVPIDIFWHPGQSAIVTTHRLLLAIVQDRNTIVEPPRQVELFEDACRQYLSIVAESNQDSWLGPATREFWQKLALQMLLNETTVLTAEQIASSAESVLSDYDALDLPKALTKIKSTLADNPLFVQYPGNAFGFISLVWRDFLAASQLAQSGMKNLVLENLNRASWETTIRFYIGRSGAADLANELIEQSGSPYDDVLFQLATWVSESLDKTEWRRKVMVKLGRLVVDRKLPVSWRQRATLALTETDEEGVIVLLKQLLQEPDPDVRQIAMASLARINSPSTVAVIERMTSDSEQEVRAAAVHALAWMDEPAAGDRLLEALLEPDERICIAAATGLALNGTSESYKILQEAIRDETMSVRRAAVSGLSLLDDTWAIDLLKSAAHEDEQRAIRSAAGLALHSLEDSDAPNYWRPHKPGDQIWLINWAVKQGKVVPVGNAAIPILIEALNDGEAEIRCSAAKTLGDLGIRSSTEALSEALKDSDSDVRNAAFEALCSIDRHWTVGENLTSAL
jgi:HEAT repeat protein